MKTIPFGSTGLMVTPLCFGTWELGGFPFFKDVDEKQAIKMLHQVLDMGICFIDTAPVYGFGRAETLLGKALQGCRDGMVISTKCGLVWDKESLASIRKDASAATIVKDIDHSLKRLQTDRIDIYYIHWPDIHTPLEESIHTLEMLKQQGKIVCYGLSNFSLEDIQKARQFGTVSAVQARYSYLRPALAEEILPYCATHKIGVQIYSPLERGLLAGESVANLKQRDEAAIHWAIKEAPANSAERVQEAQRLAKQKKYSMAQWAVDWTLKTQGVTSAIVGSTNIHHMQEIKEIVS